MNDIWLEQSTCPPVQTDEEKAFVASVVYTMTINHCLFSTPECQRRGWEVSPFPRVFDDESCGRWADAIGRQGDDHCYLVVLNDFYDLAGHVPRAMFKVPLLPLTIGCHITELYLGFADGLLLFGPSVQTVILAHRYDYWLCAGPPSVVREVGQMAPVKAMRDFFREFDLGAGKMWDFDEGWLHRFVFDHCLYGMHRKLVPPPSLPAPEVFDSSPEAKARAQAAFDEAVDDIARHVRKVRQQN